MRRVSFVRISGEFYIFALIHFSRIMNQAIIHFPFIHCSSAMGRHSSRLRPLRYAKLFLRGLETQLNSFRCNPQFLEWDLPDSTGLLPLLRRLISRQLQTPRSYQHSLCFGGYHTPDFLVIEQSIQMITTAFSCRE